MPPPWLATSCIMIAASVTPRPEPPYSSGMVMPSQPAVGHRAMKFERELAVVVARQPVVVAEARDD